MFEDGGGSGGGGDGGWKRELLLLLRCDAMQGKPSIRMGSLPAVHPT
jgi:hypothetical protein